MASETTVIVPRGSDITAMPLTAVQERRLVQLEEVVEAGLETFVKVGTALAEISDSLLYRATHATFEAYVNDRFGLSSSYAYRTIQAAKVAEIVSPIGDIANEAQARELVGLDQDQARDVFRQTIVETASSPTAAKIAEVRERIAPRPRRKSLPDQFRGPVLDLGRTVRSVTRLAGDYRLRQNAEAVRPYLNDLIRARDELALAIDQLAEQTTAAPDSAVRRRRR